MTRRLLTPLILLLTFVPAATAQTLTMQPTELHVGRTDRVTFRMTLPAGQWRVTMQMPAFVAGHEPFGSPDPLDPYGTPFTPAGPPAVSAGAAVRGGDPGTAGLGNTCRRGYDAPANPAADVTMPEGGGSLAWGFWLSRAPRWSATDHRVAFRLTNDAGADVRLVPEAPVVRGRFGTRFRLAVRRLPRGVHLVQGSTHPVLRRGRVSIMTARAKDDPDLLVPNFPADFTRPRAIASLRTDSWGRFRYRWRPQRDRYYAIWAGTFETKARRGDSSCALRIDTGT